VCYGCGETGHYKYQCPSGKNPLRERSLSRGADRRGGSVARQQVGNGNQAHSSNRGDQQKQANGTNMATVRLNNIEQTNRIAGYCKLDGISVKFLDSTSKIRGLVKRA
jgi:hypothetical protein